MLPIYDINGVPLGQMAWLKREELMRECDSNHLEHDAALSNPGWLERLYMRLGQFLMKTGQRLYAEYTSPRAASAIVSARIAQ